MRTVIGLLTQSYLVTAIGIIIGIITARGLSVEDRGLFALLMLSGQFISRVYSVGWEQDIYKNGLIAGLLNYYLVAFLSSIIGIPIVMYAATSLEISNEYLVPLVLAPLGISILRVNVAYLIYEENIRKLALINISQALSQVILYMLVFSSGDPKLFFYSWCLNTLAFGIITMLYMGRKKRWGSAGDVKWRNIHRIISGGWKFLPTVVPEMALTFSLELPLVRSVLGSTYTGVYAVANTLSNLYFQIFVAMSSVLSKKSSLPKKNMLYAGLLLIGVIIYCLSIFFIPFAFGKGYVLSPNIFLILMPATFLIGIMRVEYTSQLEMQGNKMIDIVLSVMLVLSFYLGATFVGEALIYWISLCYSAYAVANIYRIRRRVKSD